MVNSKGEEAKIGYLDGARIYNSIYSAKKQRKISRRVGTPKWMSLEMRRSLINNSKVETELPKSDIFSLGLITLYCLDTPNLKKYLSPLLSEFCDIETTKENVEDHLKKLKEMLEKYIKQNPTFS